MHTQGRYQHGATGVSGGELPPNLFFARPRPNKKSNNTILTPIILQIYTRHEIVANIKCM